MLLHWGREAGWDGLQPAPSRQVGKVWHDVQSPLYVRQLNAPQRRVRILLLKSPPQTKTAPGRQRAPRSGVDGLHLTHEHDVPVGHLDDGAGLADAEPADGAVTDLL